MSSEAGLLYFENVGQLQTALVANLSYGNNPRALSLLEFSYSSIKDDQDHTYIWSDTNFLAIKRDIIESIIAASSDTKNFPHLALAASGLLEYIKVSGIR